MDDRRKQLVLFEIVQYYVAEDAAISARTLSKMSQLKLSPTTIRNIMEDLSLEGYITGKGVSRGRIPTQKAFVDYVSSLKLKPSPSTKCLTHQKSPNFVEHLEQIGAALAQQSKQIALLNLPSQEDYELNWLKVVPINSQQLLVIINTTFNDLWCKVIDLTEELSLAIVQELEQKINDNYHQHRLASIRNAITTDLQQQNAFESNLTGVAYRLLKRIFDWEHAPHNRIYGMRNAYSIREFQSAERLKLISEDLEQPNLLAQAFQSNLELGPVKIALGNEIQGRGSSEYALLCTRVQIKHWCAYFGMLGPMRMKYKTNALLLQQARDEALRQYDQSA